MKQQILLSDLRDDFKKGNEAHGAKRKIASRKTAGTFRGAMAGAVIPKGLLAAKCARLDQARILGMEQTVDADTRVMFSAGFGHELYLEEQFKEAEIEYVREVPVKKTLETGQEWQGTPDFQIKKYDRWIGVEAKSLVSNFSVHKQMKFRWPYMRHLLQSAHYMWALERDEWLICIGHYFYAIADGEQYPPSIRWFILRKLEDGKLEIENEQSEKKTLPFKLNDVSTYLKLLSDSNAAKTLAPRAIESEIGMRSYNRCSYCPMESNCNKADNGKLGFDEWLTKLETIQKRKK